MTCQVSFTADEELKNQELEKAKNQGITLKAFLTYTMKGFIEGKISLGINTIQEESEVEELFFADEKFNAAATKLSQLLK